MLGWLTIGGLLLVGAILADDWYANRSRKPLSHMKPDPKSLPTVTGMQQLDMTRINRTIAENDRLNATNGSNTHGYMNKIVPRLREKRKEKDGPAK